jgi:predicted component of type VI protein secretion system
MDMLVVSEIEVCQQFADVSNSVVLALQRVDALQYSNFLPNIMAVADADLKRDVSFFADACQM